MEIKDNRPKSGEIGGRHVLLFLALCPLAVALGIWLQRARLAEADLMGLLSMFFGGAFVAVVLAVLPLGRHALGALGLRPAGWKALVLGPVGALGISVAVSQLGIEPKAMKEALDVVRDPSQLVFSFFVMAVLAPVVEELVFRGLLWGWLENRWGGMVALMVSSLAFAAAHFEPAHVILVLPLGLLFGWLRWKSNSLWPSLVAHVANNGLAVLASSLVG